LTKKQLVLVIILVLSITGLVYAWDFYYEIDLPLLTNVLSGLVIVLATVFGVDRLLAHRENIKWKEARRSVLLEINTCLNSMLTNIRVLAGINISALPLPDSKRMDPVKWAQLGDKIITDYFKGISEPLDTNIAQAVRRRDQKSWDNFFLGIQSCYQELDRLLAMFPSITSEAKLIEKVVAVRVACKNLHSIRMTFPDVLGIPLEQQPVPRNGDKISSSDNIHDWALKSLDELIISVVNAKDTISNSLELLAPDARK